MYLHHCWIKVGLPNSNNIPTSVHKTASWQNDLIKHKSDQPPPLFTFHLHPLNIQDKMHLASWGLKMSASIMCSTPNRACVIAHRGSQTWVRVAREVSSGRGHREGEKTQDGVLENKWEETCAKSLTYSTKRKEGGREWSAWDLVYTHETMC